MFYLLKPGRPRELALYTSKALVQIQHVAIALKWDPNTLKVIELLFEIEGLGG